MVYELYDGSSEYLVDVFSSDRNWQVARNHFVKKGYRGKYLLVGHTKTGFRVWNVDLYDSHEKVERKSQRYIPITIDTDLGTTHRFCTVQEITQERSKFRHRAFDTLSTLDDSSIKHIVYYVDNRNENGEITCAHFYSYLPLMTDESFYEWACRQKGLVGAVHRL